MTVITDVPQSGVYFQQGAIVELIFQILDINTGLPVQLQTATGLSISVGYPDLVTAQTFPATLYTDGSDGRIVYTTVNNGGQVDLFQTGLYHMQGNAFIGGVAIPPSYETDFYVLPNISGSTPSAPMTPTGVVLYDVSGVRWIGTAPPSGGRLVWAASPVMPANAYAFTDFVIKDTDGTYWLASISTAGVLTWTPGGTFPNALDYLIMQDVNGKSWLVTIVNGVEVAS